jgi:uncharacterized protein (TIGR02466 family)
MANVLDIFKTSIYEETILDKNIEKYFLNILKQAGSGVQISNKGGFQSKPFTQINPDIEQKLFIKPSIKYMQSMGLSKNVKIKTYNYWINVNNFGAYNTVHHHLPKSLSGIYFLKTPDKCGDLVFLNNFNNKNDGYFFCKDEMSPYYKTKYYITPNKNKLYLFQSDLSHMVEPNLSKEKRISVAFNLDLIKT